MSDNTTSSDVVFARQLQEKFELYLLGLIFTLLALAVQTAKFGANDVADALEIGGWFCLLASGLVGLWRLEWVPVTFQTRADLVKIQNELAQLQNAAAQGTTQVPVIDQQAPANIAELIADRTAVVARTELKIKSLEAGIRRKYDIHKWLFVCGLLLLVAARAYTPIQSLAGKQLTRHCSGLPSAAAELKR